MDLYDSTLLAAWDRISDRVRMCCFPRIRWQALVDGEWVNEPAYGRPDTWLKDAVKEMIDEGILDLSVPYVEKVVRRLMVYTPYPRQRRLHMLLMDTKRYVP